jgi:hypothetical protein
MITSSERNGTMQITQLHIERGRQMREIVQSDIVRRGLTFEQSVDSLSEYLGIQRESVLLGISLVENSESPNPVPGIEIVG